jgi:predicted TIM-barrel fold metal-dependent hydrolase
MRTITLEEHFVTEGFLRATGAHGATFSPIAAMQPKLLDLGVGRIAAMDEGGVDFQVLSLASMGLDALEAAEAMALVADVNDELAAAVKANPTRLGGFAAVALKDPDAAARELERCVTKLGFVGALVDGTVDSPSGPLFLDDPRFTPFWESAARLGVPVYVHPAPPPKVVKQAYFSGLPDDMGMLWLIVSGLFDRLPELQVIIGHMGEGLPYALARTSAVLSGPAHLRQTVAEYFQTNLHVTTSGYFTQPPLQCAVQVIGIDRMLYSVDYPFSANTRGRKFLEDAAGWLPAEELEKLIGGNAAKLLKV